MFLVVFLFSAKKHQQKPTNCKKLSYFCRTTKKEHATPVAEKPFVLQGFAANKQIAKSTF